MLTITRTLTYHIPRDKKQALAVKKQAKQVLENKAKQEIARQVPRLHHITQKGGHLLDDYRYMYGKVRAKQALLTAVYAVKITDIFHNGAGIAWFHDPTFGYLATDIDVSLGNSESESYHAGAFQANYLTQMSSDELEVTFIETEKGEIEQSYTACRNLVFNSDGTLNEPKKYAFQISVYVLNPRNTKEVAFSKSWIVGVKSANTQLNSTGRSEIIKHTITFQKLMPNMFEH